MREHPAGETGPAADTNAAEEDDADQVLAALAKLQESFDAKIRYDEVRERQVEALHQELASHRQGLYQQILQPILTELIGLFDSIADVTAARQPSADVAEPDPATLLQVIVSLGDSIAEILQRNGATTFSTEGDKVDRSRQRVIDVVVTHEPELDRKVAQRLRPGFELNGKVFRPEWVSAYRYVATEARPATAANQTP